MYTTKYFMEVRNIKNEDQYAELVKFMREKDLFGYVFEEGKYIDCTHEAMFGSFEEVRWAERPIVMIMISEKFPNMTFEITGDGESYGDLWKEYYHEGEIECCSGEIIYEQPRKIQWNELVIF